MTKKKVFGLVVFVLILAALACAFPAKVEINGGTIPSAAGNGKALLNRVEGGCDCESNVVTGFMQYTDGPARVNFTSEVQFEAPNCNVPVIQVATGPYIPAGSTEVEGNFSIGLFGKNHEYYEDSPIAAKNCVACQDTCSGDLEGCCWRLWLKDGVYDGYENWACNLDDPEKYTSEDHPGGSCQ